MKNGKAIIGVALVFILGILCGILSTHLMYTSRIESIISGKPQFREEHIVSRLDRKLDLNKQQEEQVRTIVHETHEQIQALRSQLHPQTEAIIEKSQAKIRVILTPEQQKKFEQIIAERKERTRRKGF